MKNHYLFDNKYITGGNRFVFFDSNPLVYDSKFLNWLRYEVPSVKLVLIFVNSFANRKMVDAGYFSGESRVHQMAEGQTLTFRQNLHDLWFGGEV